MTAKKKEGATPDPDEIRESQHAGASESGSGMDGGMLDETEIANLEHAAEEVEETASEKKEARPAELPVVAATGQPLTQADIDGTSASAPDDGTRVLIVQRPTANRHLVWAVFKGHEIDGPVKLRVRAADFYNRGEEVNARQVERDTWEAVTHRTAPRYPRRPPVTSR